jgi:deoxyribodipyrimidine photolyase-related protein
MIFLILPNQLFEETIKLRSYSNIYLIEEPHYFSTSEIKPNKIKIAYMRSCMQFYYDKLKKEGFNITYIDYSTLINNNYDFLKKDNCYSYEINDFKLKSKFSNLKIKINELDTPMFIMNKIDLDNYNRTNPNHSSFYEVVKKKLGILEGVKNLDSYNRSNPKKEIRINSNLTYITKQTFNYYKEGIEYANSQLFKESVGNPTLDLIKFYPINSKDAIQAYYYFLDNNLENFGEYQDVIRDNNPFNYHSIISPMLNIGLLTPIKLVEIAKKYKSKVPINSYEGFLRQLIGWREYMHYLYSYKYFDLIQSNNYNNQKLIDKSWYTGKTGILILDTEIKKAINYGYAHHIIRLMVFLNYLLLSEIRPTDIYKWFMEVVSIDAYDWVMIPNIYSMGYFSKIGMKRPYLSSSNYLLKMSNYKKDGKWDVDWTEKFRNFVKLKKIGFYLRSIKN